MRLTGLEVISKEVLVALSKPASMSTRINVTLYVEGTDKARPASWEVLNSSLLLERSPWLQLPAISGGTDVQAIMEGNYEVQVPLVLSAHGLRERAVPYLETLPIDVRSLYAPAAKMQLLQVALSVHASTSYAVWGHISPDAQPRCVRSFPERSSAVVGALLQYKFTACDVDDLPVDHQLPTNTDERRFESFFDASHHSQASAL
eukprot:5355188-Prymnesium_polylepis.1